MQLQDHIPPGSVWRHPRFPPQQFVRHQPSLFAHRPRSPPVIAPQPDQVVSVALILTGVVSVPGAREEEYLVVLLLAVCLLLLILLFKLSKVVSVLSMKNQELAMQVSLLNQENPQN